MTPIYRIGEENWKFFEEKGFLGIPCWGGTIMRHPDYKNVLFDLGSPQAEIISDEQMYRLVSMLRGAAE